MIKNTNSEVIFAYRLVDQPLTIHANNRVHIKPTLKIEFKHHSQEITTKHNY